MYDRTRLPLDLWLGRGMPLNPYLRAHLVWILREEMKPKELRLPEDNLFEMPGREYQPGESWDERFPRMVYPASLGSAMAGLPPYVTLQEFVLLSSPVGRAQLHRSSHFVRAAALLTFLGLTSLTR